MMISVPSTKYSLDLSDLYFEIQKYGFEVSKVKYDKKKNRYVATAKNDSRKLESFGANEKQALIHLLNMVGHSRSSKIQLFTRWHMTFESQLVPIAEAYAKAPAYEKKAASAFMDLAAECTARARVIGEHIKVMVTHNPEPYLSPDKMFDDIRKRRKLEVSDIGSDQHPIWSREQVVNYRICLDVLGYTAANSDWRWEGTNHAFASFAPVLPELAQSALFTELIGQTAYATYYRAYGPVKVCLLNKFVEHAQHEENPHKGFRGIHPSQMLLPQVQPEAKVSKVKPIRPNTDGTLPFDINDGWSSTLENIPTINYTTDYPDFLGLRDTTEVLDSLHTDWADPIHDDGDEAHVRQEWRMYKQDDPEGALGIMHAVANAVKAGVLSDGHSLGHAAIKYQSLLHKFADDPEKLWKRLDDARSEWNTQRFGDHTAEEHRPWMVIDTKTGNSPITRLAGMLYDNSDISPKEAYESAQRLIHEMLTRFHHQIEEQESDPGATKDVSGWSVEQKAIKLVMRWIALATNHQGPFDHWMLQSSDTSNIGSYRYGHDYDRYDNHKVFNMQRFPATRGHDLRTIAKLMKHMNQITEEALVDVHSHDGKGHHFRSFIMSLTDLKPKVVGFMWLLLAPYTSQLSMIDDEMSGALGHHPDDNNARDYFLHERELMAHRDGMGLSHIPLGQFSTSLRGEPNQKESSVSHVHHQDLSAFRVKDPTPAWKPKWHSNDQLIYDFSLTPNVSKPIKEQWEKSVATKFAPNEIPSKISRPPFIAIASDVTPEPFEPEPEISKMQKYRNLGMTVQDVWNHIDDPSVKVGSVRKVADKLHDFLMNPKSRPDLQSPEAQNFLNYLEHYYHNDKTDQLLPWLTREWKKKRLLPPDTSGGATHRDYSTYVNPDDPLGIGQTPLTRQDLMHWADFMNSRHPLKKQMGDIMQHPIHDFANNYIAPWDTALANAQQDELSNDGRIVHTTPDNWTIRHLTKPNELKNEGDAMGHCVGGYCDAVDSGNSMIYSLRDPQGNPHATIEIEPKRMTDRSWKENPNWLEDYIQEHGNELSPDVVTGLRNYDQAFNEHERRSRDHLPALPYDREVLEYQPLHGKLKNKYGVFPKEPIMQNGEIVQIQGKQNKDPLPEYKDKIRNWFESIPYHERPTMEDDNFALNRPEEIQAHHLNPGSMNEYGVPSVTPPRYYDSLVSNSFPAPSQGWGDEGYYEPELGERVYELAKAHDEIPELARAVHRFENRQYTPDFEYDLSMDPRDVQEEFGDDNGNIDEDAYQRRMDELREEQYQEWRRNDPIFQGIDDFNDMLRPHFNPETNQYDKGVFT